MNHFALDVLHHLESYPPARIGQNCTYLSEHCDCMYLFMNFRTFMNVYIHVHEFAYLYIPCRHGVSLPELKKSTNLKMHLKSSVQDVWQNGKSSSTVHCSWYTL